VRLRDRVGLSPRRQAKATWLMEVGLVGMLFIGVERGNVGIVVNTAVALLVTQLPPIMERDYDVPMDPAITLWITGAVFLHALGTVGLPGRTESFYRSVWWWDHVTHALSSSVVSAVGYATTRALDQHSDKIHFLPKFTFVLVLLFVVAFGVFWEVIEFGVGGLASLTGSATVLTQYGLGDTMLDLVFDVIGGVIVAVWGTAYLTDITGAIAERMEGDAAD